MSTHHKVIILTYTAKYYVNVRTTFSGMRVFAAWMMSLTIAGEMVSEMGSIATVMSMAGLSIGPMSDSIIEQGRRTLREYKTRSCNSAPRHEKN